MIYINKTSAPESYTNFLLRNATTIQDKIDDSDQTGGNMWKWFRNKKTILKDLKIRLLEDQGCICCYCGERIDLNNTVIEHLDPKKDKSVVFPFSNQYASCIGGKKIYHKIGNSETITSIVTRFNTTTANLQSLNPNKRFIPGECINIYDADSNGEHCDHKKNGTILKNKPNQIRISEKLKYEFTSSSEVEIKSIDQNDTELIKDINDTLELNQQTLKERRAIVLNKLDEILVNNVDYSKDEDEVTDIYSKLIEVYKSKNNNKFDPFYFVCISYIEECALKYIDINC